MNKYKLHKLLSNMVDGMERDQLDVKVVLKILAEEIKDPFASQIDEYLVEKSSKDHPQEDAIDELKDEALDYKDPVEQDHPQEDAVDELKDEAIDYKDPVEQDSPQEDAVDKVVDEIKDDEDEEEDEDEGNELAKLREKQDQLERQMEDLRDKKDAQIESALKQISEDLVKRGYRKIANKFVMASSKGIVEVLNNLLMKEFLVRDILENYSYLFLPEEAKKAASLKPKESVMFLQKQILAFGGKPTTQRLVIPAINPASSEGVLALVKEHGNRLIADYMDAIKSIEGEDKYLTLKIMFERIIQSKR